MLNGGRDISLKFFSRLTRFLRTKQSKKFCVHAAYLLYLFKTGKNANYLHYKVFIGWKRPLLPSCGRSPKAILEMQIAQVKQISLNCFLLLLTLNDNNKSLRIEEVSRRVATCGSLLSAFIFCYWNEHSKNRYSFIPSLNI